MTDIRPLIGLAADGPLTPEDAGRAFAAMLDGWASQPQIAGLLMAMRARGETPEEIAAAVGAMRDRMIPIAGVPGAIDIVGTGGDGKATLNISTASAIVAAGAGVPVAKHGNRNVSSKSGSADAISNLGVNVMAPPEVAQAALEQAGLCFMMAPVHHPAMRYVGPVRADLAARTIFNVMGPLSNPAGVRRQLTGAFAPQWLEPMARVLQHLGSEAAWLVWGHEGIDEVSITGPTTVVALNGGLERFEITPADAGLPTHPFEAIIGGDPSENAAAMQRLLEGEGGAYRDAVLLNVAAALVVAGRAKDLAQGAEMAAKSIDSGAAKARLADLVRVTGGANGTA